MHTNTQSIMINDQTAQRQSRLIVNAAASGVSGIPSDCLRFGGGAGAEVIVLRQVRTSLRIQGRLAPASHENNHFRVSMAALGRPI